MPFDFPDYPLTGQKYTYGSITYIWNGYGWVSEPLPDFVNVTGDLMTGQLTIRTPGTLGQLILDNPVVTDVTTIGLKKNNTWRWSINATAGPEPGAEVGTNFSIRRYSDTGVLFGDTPFHINRATGRAQVGQQPVDPNDIATKTYVDSIVGGGPGYLPLTGGTLTGGLTAPVYTLAAPAGQNADEWVSVGGVMRWLTRRTDNYELHRYNDAGAYLGSPLQISRATGLVNMGNGLNVTGALNAYTSFYTPSGSIGSLSSDNATITNCTSYGTFNLTAVTCNTLTANAITDYGALVVHGATTIYGTTYPRNIEMNGSLFVHTADGMHSSIFTRQINGELGIWIVDRQDINVMRIEMVRGIYTDGSRSFTVWDTGGVYSTWGYTCKGGIYGGPKSNAFNFDWSNGLWSWVDNTVVGMVAMQSDYRIKRNVENLSSMWQRVKKLRPISYNMADFDLPVPDDQQDFGSDISSEFYRKGRDIHPDKVLKREESLFKADDIERWGFVAHELQETLIADAATGFKDSPGHIQSPNQWTVLAALTKALQEAMERIEMIELRLGMSH